MTAEAEQAEHTAPVAIHARGYVNDRSATVRINGVADQSRVVLTLDAAADAGLIGGTIRLVVTGEGEAFPLGQECEITVRPLPGAVRPVEQGP